MVTSTNPNPNPNPNPGVVKNKPLELHYRAEPTQVVYNAQDLLTKTIEINPNWDPEIDGDNNRYIEVYTDEGYTGFLPVSLTIDDPNFVHQWADEQEGEFKSLPINKNGKYKFLFNNGQLGPFAIGYVPVKLANQNTDDYDFSILIEKS